MDAKGDISIGYNHTLSITAGLGTNKDTLQRAVKVTWSDGTGAGQVNHGWHNKRTLAAGAYEELDLSSLTGLETAWLEDIQFDGVKALLFQNLDATPSNVLNLGPGSASGWTNWVSDVIVVRGGMSLLFVASDDDAAGIAVAAGSNDVIRVQNPGASAVQYGIALLGVKTS